MLVVLGGRLKPNPVTTTHSPAFDPSEHPLSGGPSASSQIPKVQAGSKLEYDAP
jgi:hypothetical protein